MVCCLFSLLLFGVCCLLFVVRCFLFVVCCLLFVCLFVVVVVVVVVGDGAGRSTLLHAMPQSVCHEVHPFREDALVYIILSLLVSNG